MLRALYLFWMLWSVPVLAQDLGRETRMAQEMELRESRETLWLEAAGGRFAALYRPAIGGRRRGGMVLVPDSGVAPDGGLLQAVRRDLAEHGWSTLAIVTPIAEPDAPDQRSLELLPQGLARIEAGLQYLRGQSAEPAVLVGQGLGALMAARFMAERPEASPKAVVLIDAPITASLEPALLEALGKIKAPLLDILAQRGTAAVPEAALQRRRAQRENPGYRQRLVYDSRSGYGELRETLGNLIHGWLSRTLDGPPEGEPAAPAPDSAPAPAERR